MALPPTILWSIARRTCALIRHDTAPLVLEVIVSEGRDVIRRMRFSDEALAADFAIEELHTAQVTTDDAAHEEHST